jgi:hypothetical protein
MPLAPLAPVARQRVFSDLGTVISGAQLWSYESNTVTPLATYSDSALTIAHPNPVIASAGGLFPQVFLLPQAYSFTLKASTGTLIWQADNVEDVGSVLSVAMTALDDTAAALAATTQTKFCTTQFDATSGTTGTTLTTLTGLSGFTLAAAGVYKFEIDLSGVSTANCGLKIGFKYTTATLTNLEAVSQGFTASAVAVQHVTSTTDQATLFGQTAAVISVRITGRLTVNAAGTLAVQAAQNAAHADLSSIFTGSSATFTKVA